MRTRWVLVLMFVVAAFSVIATVFLTGVIRVSYVRDSPESRRIDDAEQRKVARHEAGHAIVAAVLSGPREVERIRVFASLPPDGLFGDCQTADHNRLDTSDDIMRDAAVFMGGRAADKIVNGAPTNGATRDLVHVNDAIWTMHLVNGLGGSLLIRPRNEAPESVTAEVERDIESANRCAEVIVAANRPTIEALGDLVVAQPSVDGVHVLSGDAFRTFLKDHPLVPPPAQSEPGMMPACHMP